LLGRLGYQKTTMDDIAAEAGVGRRSIYVHFDGKEEVALATIDRIVDRLLVRLEALADSEEPAPEKIRRMLAERVLFRFDSVRGYFHSIDEIFRSLRSAYMARRASYFHKEAAVFERVLRQGCAAGELGADDPATVAPALLLATNALLPSSLSTRELGRRSDVEERVQRIAQLLVHGLAPVPGGAGDGKPGTRKRSRQASRD
jgi:AcrR family transcriptional regulator